MIGLSILGVFLFRIFDLMYSTTFDILIKILEGLSTSDPNTECTRNPVWNLVVFNYCIRILFCRHETHE